MKITAKTGDTGSSTGPHIHIENPTLLPRIASVLTWIYGYAEGLARSEDPKIADIGKELLQALHEGKS